MLLVALSNAAVTMQSVQTIRRKDYCVINRSCNMNDYKAVNPNHGYYIAGFVDGEGSFNVSLKKRADYENAWKVTASFNVSQKDRVILSFIKKVIGCGTLRERKDGVVYYEVTNISALHENVIPFLRGLRSFRPTKKETSQSSQR